MTAAPEFTMRLILIYGEQGAGKTTACVKIMKILHTLDAQVLLYSEMFDEDFKAVVRYAGKRIAIYSPGDECAHLKEAIQFGDDNQCDCLIAAVRKGTHYNTVLPEPTDDDRPDWIELDASDSLDDKILKQNEVVLEIIVKLSSAGI